MSLKQIKQQDHMAIEIRGMAPLLQVFDMIMRH
jgi:hypothetical protein